MDRSVTIKGSCNNNRSSQNDQRTTLTYKLWGTKDVFEIVAKIDLVGQTKVNELNAGMGHAPVQQHDVLWLRERDRNKEKSRREKKRSKTGSENDFFIRTFDKYRTKRKSKGGCTRKQEIGHNTWKSHAKLKQHSLESTDVLNPGCNRSVLQHSIETILPSVRFLYSWPNLLKA